LPHTQSFVTEFKPGRQALLQKPFEDEAQTVLFKDPVRTAL